jgi:hypothetical protein
LEFDSMFVPVAGTFGIRISSFSIFIFSRLRGRRVTAQDRSRTIADSTGKSSDSAKGAAKSAAIDPELAELSAQWHTLPAIIKAAILAVARQHLTAAKKLRP